VGTQTIVLYKATDPKIWGALGRNVTHISTDEEESALRMIQECLKDL
jgi:hypothetical protein